MCKTIGRVTGIESTEDRTETPEYEAGVPNISPRISVEIM